LLEEVQKEKRTKEEEELRNMKREAEVWKFINKKRGVRKWNENNIGEEEWRSYFMELLEGEKMEIKEEVRVGEIGKVMEEEIGIGEVRNAIKKLKVKKVAGIDGIPIEAWKFIGGELIKELADLMKSVWIQGILPCDWRLSIIVPLYKRGEKEAIGNYRGISLLCSAYKVYAEILRNRLETEVERMDLIPESQTGFRRGRSILDNIFILNHVMQREKRYGEEDGRVYLFFVDLKAAFDKLDKNRLREELRRIGIKEELVRGVEKIYEETIVTVRTGKGLSRSFRTTKGVKQGCVMSSSV